MQINNWNEYRKDRKTETQILNELKENLELNIKEFNKEIERKEKSDFSSKVILTALENDLPYHDSLSKHFGWALSFEDPGPLSVAGYQSFKNTGTNILQNQDLKKELIYLFEDTYALSNTRLTRLMELNVETVKLRQKHLMRLSGFEFRPFEYDKLINDQVFESWTRTIRNSRGWGRSAMEESLSETQRVLQLISDELAKEE